ncbi:MAG TPA: TolC family protein [Bacteroidales bacterium]|jgi:outer membrane protein TolC|nr:TolC family protein [Bacteroidales bacterium]
MKTKLLLFSILITCLSLSVRAQKVYNLDDCIKTGLERNFSLLITRNNEAIAKNNYTLGNAGFLPSLDLSSKYSGTLNDIRREMTDGTETTSNGENNTVTTAGLTANMTIFNGFNVVTSYKKLNELKQVGELNTQLSIENLVAEIISAYYNYIQQTELRNNLEYAVALSKERLRIDEDRYLLGSSSKLQVLQSRVYLNADSSRLSRQLEVVRSAEIRLNELMAVEDLSQKFLASDTSVVVKPDLLYETLLEETLAKNTSIQIASKNKTISEYDYRIIASRSYPYLNASTGYTYSLNTYSSSQTDRQHTKGLNYGLTLGMNLFDGFNQRRSIRNAAIDINNKDLRLKEIEQGVRADLITLYSAYSNYLRLITLENQNLQTATENLEIAIDMYKLGSLSGLDLREVQKSLLDARESLFSVEYQAKLAEISLMMISGRIMEYLQ